MFENQIISKSDYIGYAKAMAANKKRPISWQRLDWHIFNHAEIKRFNSAWIAGQYILERKDEIFTPSHVGYNSKRDLISLLNSLLDGEEKVAFAVLPDMGKMLERLGYIYAGRMEVDYPIQQEKVFYVNQVEMIPSVWWEN